METKPLPAYFVAIVLVLSAIASAANTRQITSFDPNWRFAQKDLPSGQDIALDDSTWTILDVPHDWSIEGAISASNPSGQPGGFFPDGISWYRKHFTLPQSDSQKRVFIDFDGVMANSDVWINGVHLGNRPYGYVSFEYELTGHLNFGDQSPNILAVCSNTQQQPSSRYYLGSGITRHVRLVVTDLVHIVYNSLFITTPEATTSAATVHVQGTIVNQGDTARDVTVHTAVLGPGGAAPAASAASPSLHIEAGKSADFAQDVQVTNPKLWNLDDPQLYQAAVSLADGDKTLDDVTTTIGIRTFKFDPATGFSLNGKNIRIQGVGLHEDGGAFGVAVPAGAWQRRLSALKEWGINAIRLAHNPPDPALLDMCDRTGLLVMEEMFDCWDVAKRPYDYHLNFDQWSLIDIRDTVRRDRNHPSIILYSTGNEIRDTQNAQKAVTILSGLVKEFHADDPTRPVTQSLFRPTTNHDYTDGVADLLDVVGTNYRMSELLAAQQTKPKWSIIGTENHMEDIRVLAENPPLSGIFLWIGVDYLGDSHLQPGVHGESGLLDRTNAPKAWMYQAATAWRTTPFVHMLRGEADGPTPTAPSNQGVALPMTQAQKAEFRGPAPDWSPTDQSAHPETVTVYSNCPSVELFLNGASVGKTDARGDNSAFSFQVPFAPGVLKATAYDSAGKPVATEELHTAGPAAKIVLTPDQAQVADDWDDVSYVRATVTDANGIPIELADNEITFTVTGAGKLAAVDNADGNSLEPFRSAKRQAYGGTCMAMVKATADSGAITITASADGLATGTCTLQAAAASPGNIDNSK